MHQIIAGRAGIDISNQIDHINRDKLDNRRENLRPATPSQNQANCIGGTESGYKGVFAYHDKWKAQIRIDGVTYHLGVFNTPKEAHQAYITAARQLHREFAHD